MTRAELIRWAHQEIRDLDEACRWGIPNFDSLNSEEMEKLEQVLKLADELEKEDK